MLSYIDNFLNRISMYRLVLYYLFALVGIAVVLSFFGLLNYNPVDIAFEAVVLLIVSLVANKVLSMVFRVPTNNESDYITALILALIITPSSDFHTLPFLLWAAIIAQASKYILVWHGKHIFNPAAFAVALTSFTIGASASWWVGTAWMVPFVIIGGFLVVRKIQRFDLVLTFLFVATVAIIYTSPSSSPMILKKILLDSPILFFSFIMLTEPQTTPPTQVLRVFYGALVGVLFAPRIHFGQIYLTPELALLVGNIFSYAVSNKERYVLSLKSKASIATEIYGFVFHPNRKVNFRPGQYMEWTVSPKGTDLRGNRRYFTIASSPTEEEIELGIRFYDPSSTFKKHLKELNAGDKILAGQLAGDFTLPNDKKKKLVFIAGGIGITPFRSMLKYLIDQDEKRDIVLFYSVNSIDEVAYKDILDKAKDQLGVKVVIVETGKNTRVSRDMLTTEVPDYKDRIFYLSGPHKMVNAFQVHLDLMEIPGRRIKIDFFPGYV